MKVAYRLVAYVYVIFLCSGALGCCLPVWNPFDILFQFSGMLPLAYHLNALSVKTPSVHKTVIIAVFTKDVQLLLDKLLFDFHYWNSLFDYWIAISKALCIIWCKMWNQFIPTIQNKLQKLAEYFFPFLVSVFGLEIATQCNVHNGLMDRNRPGKDELCIGKLSTGVKE